MKIDIQSVVAGRGSSDRREITFADVLYEGEGADFQLTPIGTRAVRILRSAAAPHTHIGFLAANLVMMSGVPKGVLLNRRSVQAKMKELADTPIEVTFGRTVVRPYRDNCELTSPEEVAQWRAAGTFREFELMRVLVEARLNLPVVHTDWTRVRRVGIARLALWPEVRVPLEEDPYVLRVEVLLKGHYASNDPWKVAERLKALIISVVV